MQPPAPEKTFDRQGVRFRYPAHWQLEEERADEEQWCVTLQSPGTGFISLTVLPLRQNRFELLRQALSVFEAEYAEIDAYQVEDEIASLPAVGHDLNFFCLDLTNTAYLRVFNSPTRSFFLMAQCTDAELEEFELVYRSVLKSLTIEDDPDGTDWLFTGRTGVNPMIPEVGGDPLAEDVDDW